MAEISSLCDKRPPPRSEDLPRLSQTDQLPSFTQPWEFPSHIYRAVTSLFTPQLPLLSQDSVSHQVNNRKHGNQSRWLLPLQARRPLKGSAEDCGSHTHEFLWPYSWILTSREAFRQWTIISEDFLAEF